MIRKYARLNAPVQLLTDIFADTGRWDHWMPGVERVTSVRASGNMEIVDLDLRHMGRQFRQRVERRVIGSSVRVKQISGLFKSWQSTWSFSPAPGDAGTTVSSEQEFDLGMMALVVPARWVQDEIDRLFDETVAGARRELHARASATGAGAEESGETVLEVYETRTGFEVWVGGRRFDVGKIP